MKTRADPTRSLDMTRAAEMREQAVVGVPKSVLAREFGVNQETVDVYLRAGTEPAADDSV